jgi:ABC-type transport system involved in cytochrome bd biosynthesis fused ATPase/permease subunit
MQRINKFLEEEDVPKWVSSFTLPQQDSQQLSDSFQAAFHDASFQWHIGSSTDTGSTPFTLGPLNIAFPKEKLTLVSGATGSGKTALLRALLGGKSLQGTILSIHISCSRNEVHIRKRSVG